MGGGGVYGGGVVFVFCFCFLFWFFGTPINREISFCELVKKKKGGGTNINKIGKYYLRFHCRLFNKQVVCKRI